MSTLNDIESIPSAETTMTATDAVVAGLLVAVIGLLLCLPAFINGQPFFFWDTPTYVRGPDFAVTKLLGPDYSSEWLSSGQSRLPVEGHSAAKPVPETTSVRDSTGTDQTLYNPATAGEQGAVIWKGRSIYYGALIYAGYLLGAFWPSVLIQALLISYVAFLATRLIAGPGRAPFLLAGMTLLLLTPAPWYASLLMPDVLAGIMILAVGVFIGGYRKLHRYERWLLWFIITYAAMGHDSHAAILLPLIAFAAVTLPLMGVSLHSRHSWSLLALCAALGVTITGGILFDTLVKAATGQRPLRIPIPMAQMIEDGPGTRYVQEHCDPPSFTVCRFKDQFPLNSDIFLFSPVEGEGVFFASDPQTRQAISEEQFSFMLATLLSYPLDQLLVSLRNWGHQLIEFSPDDFNYPADRRLFLDAKVPPDYLADMQKTLSYRERIPLQLLISITYIATVLAAVYLILMIAATPLLRNGRKEILLIVLLVLAGIAINAAICGIFAGVYGRYQARVIWVFPLLIILLEFYLQRELGGGLLSRLFSRRAASKTIA
jgi:MFS family permease